MASAWLVLARVLSLEYQDTCIVRFNEAALYKIEGTHKFRDMTYSVGAMSEKTDVQGNEFSDLQVRDLDGDFHVNLTML